MKCVVCYVVVHMYFNVVEYFLEIKLKVAFHRIRMINDTQTDICKNTIFERMAILNP